MIKRDLLVDCFAPDLFIVLAVEWQVPTKHQIRDDSKGPTIDTFIVWLLEKDLGCHVAERAIGLAARFTGTKSA